jgi:hypothetical protein
MGKCGSVAFGAKNVGAYVVAAAIDAHFQPPNDPAALNEVQRWSAIMVARRVGSGSASLLAPRPNANCRRNNRCIGWR